MQLFQRSRIHYLVRIADQYWASARLLWTLGISHPALHNLNHAIELYLRAAWLTDQSFKSESEMDAGLKKFHRSTKNKPHDFATMLARLPKSVQDELKKQGVKGFWLVNDEVVRYGEAHGFGYGDAPLAEVDDFIKKIRVVLGYQKPKNNYEIISKSTFVSLPKNQDLALRGIKQILSSANKISDKKRNKELMRAIEKALKNYRQQNQ